MSGDGVVDIPVTGKVDAALIQGLIDLGKGLEEAAKKTDESASKTERAVISWRSFSDGVRKAADTFNEVHAAISTNVAMVTGFADGVARLAAEQAHLTASAQRLGLDYDQAAAAAGRFVDEVDVMSVANQFAARDIRLTQEQFDAFFRVAGSRAEELGVSVGQAAEQLTQALIRGREAGLDRFGQALGEVAGEGHLMGDRLAALVVQAGQVRQGTDDAATAMERLRDSMEDAQRIAASSFVDTLTRIESLADKTRTARTEVADLDDKMSALGSTAARTLELVGRPIAGLLGVIGLAARAAAASAIITAAYRGGAEAGNRAAREQLEALREMARFIGDQGGALGAAWGDTNGRSSSGAPSNDNAHGGGGPQVAQRADMSFTEAQAAANASVVGSHGQAIAGNDGLTRSEAAIADEQAKNKANERLAAAQGTHHARKEELEKIWQIHEAEHRARQEAELRQAAARRTADDREREARAFNEWFTAQMNAAAQMDQARKARDAETANSDSGRQSVNARAQLVEELRRASREEAVNDGVQERTLRASLQRRTAEIERAYEAQRSVGERLRDHFSDQASAAQTAADSIVAAYDRMTAAAGAHFAAWVTGKETFGDAMQGMVHDTLAAFAEIAAQQAIMELGRGLAALFLNPAEAAAHFGAAVLFGVVAGGAGVASQAVPSPSDAAKTAGSAAPNRQLSDRPSRSSGEGLAPIIINNYAPVIGGREVTSAEVGVRLGRYDDAAQRTRVQQRAA